MATILPLKNIPELEFAVSVKNIYKTTDGSTR